MACEYELLHAIFPWNELFNCHLRRLEDVQLEEVYHLRVLVGDNEVD